MASWYVAVARAVLFFVKSLSTDKVRAAISNMLDIMYIIFIISC